MRSSGEMDDIPKAGKHFIITPLGDGQEHYDYVTVREFLQLDSTRPIHEMIMALEYLRLAQARDLICSLVPQKAIRQCRTDCWLVSTSKKKANELKKLLDAQTFKTIQRITPFLRWRAPSTSRTKSLFASIPSTPQRSWSVTN